MRECRSFRSPMVARARRLPKISLPIGEREQRVRIELAVLECRFRFCIIDRHACCGDRRGRWRRVARRLRPSRPEYEPLGALDRVSPLECFRLLSRARASTLRRPLSRERRRHHASCVAIDDPQSAHHSSLITNHSSERRLANCTRRRQTRAVSPEPRVASRESRIKSRAASRELGHE